MEEIAQCPEAFGIVSQATEIALGRKLTVGEGIWDMIRSMRLETVCEMAGGETIGGFLESLNAKLTEIDK